MIWSVYWKKKICGEAAHRTTRHVGDGGEATCLRAHRRPQAVSCRRPRVSLFWSLSDHCVSTAKEAWRFMKSELLRENADACSSVGQKAPCLLVSVCFVLEFRKSCTSVVLITALCFEGKSVLNTWLSFRCCLVAYLFGTLVTLWGQTRRYLLSSLLGAIHHSKDFMCIVLCKSDESPGRWRWLKS